MKETSFFGLVYKQLNPTVFLFACDQRLYGLTFSKRNSYELTDGAVASVKTVKPALRRADEIVLRWIPT